MTQHDHRAHADYRQAWLMLKEAEADGWGDPVLVQAAEGRLRFLKVPIQDLAWNPEQADWDADILAQEECHLEHQLRLVRAELAWRRGPEFAIALAA